MSENKDPIENLKSIRSNLRAKQRKCQETALAEAWSQGQTNAHQDGQVIGSQISLITNNIKLLENSGNLLVTHYTKDLDNTKKDFAIQTNTFGRKK